MPVEELPHCSPESNPPTEEAAAQRPTPAVDNSPLALACPTATPAERSRFLRHAKGNVMKATTLLQTHLAWREASLPPPPDVPVVGRGLPDCARILEGTYSTERNCVFLAVAGMVDPAMAPPETYGHGIAVLVDSAFERDSEEEFTLLMDVGPVPGGGSTPPPPSCSV